jgi:hypothetical protein
VALALAIASWIALVLVGGTLVGRALSVLSRFRATRSQRVT